MGVGQGPLQATPVGAVADHHQLGAGAAGQHAQPVDVLLGRQAAHVAHDGRSRRCPPTQPEAGRPAGRVELGVVHSPTPHRHPGEAAAAQLVGHRVGGGQRDAGPVVDRAQPTPDRGAGRPQTVGTGEAHQIGLEHGHGGDAQPGCHLPHPGPQHHRRRQMDDVGAVGLDEAAHPAGGGHAHPQVGVAGHVEPPHPDHVDPAAAGQLDLGLTRSRRHHQGPMAGPGEVVEHPQHGVGHPVDLGQEALGRDEDAYPAAMAIHGTRAWRAGMTGTGRRCDPGMDLSRTGGRQPTLR